MQFLRDFNGIAVYCFFMQRLLIILLLTILPFQTALSQELETSAQQAYIIDYQTGSILYKKNEDEKMPTSSMSKVMTMLAVFKAIEDGRLSLEDELLVSEKAWKKGGSKMFVEVGKKVKGEDFHSTKANMSLLKELLKDREKIEFAKTEKTQEAQDREEKGTPSPLTKVTNPHPSKGK